MLTTLCLWGCALAAAQPADRSEWLLVPQFARGQELVYRGTFAEEALGGGVEFNRGYRVEARLLVLDTPPTGAEVALLTVLRQRGSSERGEDAAGAAVRLELATVGLQGAVAAQADAPLRVPLEGPPTVECGMLVEVPRGRVKVEQSWDAVEEGRPPRGWRAVGTDTVNGVNCLKLVGMQQSEDWDRPRADRTAWRRRDTVWLAPRAGVAHKVERVIERREPARAEPTSRSVLRYELESSLQYPGQLFEDRRREVVQAHRFQQAAAPLVQHPGKSGPQLEALLGKIRYHLENQPPTPYRDAVVQAQKRVEAGLRGEAPPAPLPEEKTPPSGPASVGRPAPDFVAPDLVTQESARLKNWVGRPVVLVFYSPTARSAEKVLPFAQELHERYGKKITVVGLSMSEDAAPARKQRDELKLTFPLLKGTGLRHTFEVEATPKVVVLDAAGVVRGGYVGWGQETPAEVVAELKRWLATGEPPKR